MRLFHYLAASRWRMGTLLFAVAAIASLGITFNVLAAWQGYAENDGNTVTATVLSHSNQADPAASPPGNTCTSTSATPACSAIVPPPGAATYIVPSSGTSGSVQIINTGTQAAGFTLSSSAAGAACADMTLSVSDAATGTTVYSGPVGIATPAVLPAASGSSWAAAESHTYSVTTSLSGLANANNNTTCTFSTTFQQSVGGWTGTTTNTQSVTEITRPNALTAVDNAAFKTDTLTWTYQVSNSQSGYYCTYRTGAAPCTAYPGGTQLFGPGYSSNTYSGGTFLPSNPNYHIRIDIRSVFPQETTDGNFDCAQNSTGAFVCTPF